MIKGFKVLDLSMPIKSLETPVFPRYPQPLKATFTTIKTHGYNSHVWVLVEHTSTHVDAPKHFMDEGPAIDEIPAERYVGWATAIDLSDVEPEHVVSKEEIKERLERLPFSIEEGWVLLMHTGYSSKAGTPEWFRHPGLGEDACRYLVKLRVKAIGCSNVNDTFKYF